MGIPMCQCGHCELLSDDPRQGVVVISSSDGLVTRASEDPEWFDVRCAHCQDHLAEKLRGARHWMFSSDRDDALSYMGRHGLRVVSPVDATGGRLNA